MPQVEYVKPDLVTTSNQPVPEWAELAPCPNCGSMPHDAPEGVNRNGDPHWVHNHCWKCGHRPGTNVAVDLRVMREQFEAFQQFVRQNTPNHPTLNPPSDQNTIDELQSRMADLEAMMASSRGSGGEQFSGPSNTTVSGEPAAPPKDNG